MDDGAPTIGGLERAEKRLRLFEMAERVAHIGHWRWEIATGEVTWSEEVYRIHGVDPAQFEVTLESALAAYHPDDREKVQADLEQALSEKAAFDFELRIVRPTGEVRRVYSVGECECDADGSVSAVFGVFQDVTERHQQQEANARFVASFDASDEVLAIFDADDRLVFCNQQFRDINSDTPQASRIGTKFEDHLRARLAGGKYKDAIGREEEWFQERMRRHRDESEPFEFQRANGDWLLIGEQRLNDGSTLMRATNITPLKRAQAALQESENRFRDFAQASSDWFWEMDENLRFIEFSERQPDNPNPASARYLGKRRDEVAQEDTRTEKWRRHLDDLANERPFNEFRYRVEGREGLLYHLSVSGIPVYDSEGRFRGYRGTGKDVTGEVRAAQALHESARAARRAAEAKSQFLATMSHEFRTPLNAILGFSEMIQRQELGEEQRAHYQAYADHIHASGERMLALVNDILDLSTVEAGKRKLIVEQVSLESLFQACVIEVSASVIDGAAVETEVAPDAAVIHTDRQALHQILVNLLGNARKFTPSTGKVMLGASATAGGNVRITIEDTGSGMSPQLISRLGEPFLRAQANPERAVSGTGLGFSIVKGLVDALNGSIEVHSEEGSGTRITLILPSKLTD